MAAGNVRLEPASPARGQLETERNGVVLMLLLVVVLVLGVQLQQPKRLAPSPPFKTLHPVVVIRGC
jgi:hypothetical protein